MRSLIKGDRVRVLPSYWNGVRHGEIGYVYSLSVSQEGKPTAYVRFACGGDWVHIESLERVK